MAAVSSLNLACSGAKTYTSGGGGSDFKPGIDFANTAYGKGQALALQEFASTHNVKMVAVMIGANDFGFADILQACFVELADLAVVVAELLLRRQRHRRRASRRATSRPRPPPSGTRCSTCARR